MSSFLLRVAPRAAAALLVLVAPAAAAQSVSPSPAAPTGAVPAFEIETPAAGDTTSEHTFLSAGRICPATPGPSDSARVTLHATLQPARGFTPISWMRAEPLLAAMMATLQRGLPAAEGGLPDATGVKRFVDGEGLRFAFVLRRDGSVGGFGRYRESDSTIAGELADALLALASARGIPADEASGPDSTRLVFRLAPDMAVTYDHGDVRQTLPPMSAPLLSMVVPRERPVIARNGSASPRYPDFARSYNITATILMQFVVDVNGHVEPESIRDIGGRNAIPNRPLLRDAYDAFVAAARTSLARATFEPARSGGCITRQLVQQPFIFELQR